MPSALYAAAVYTQSAVWDLPLLCMLPSGISTTNSHSRCYLKNAATHTRPSVCALCSVYSPCYMAPALCICMCRSYSYLKSVAAPLCIAYCATCALCSIYASLAAVRCMYIAALYALCFVCYMLLYRCVYAVYLRACILRSPYVAICRMCACFCNTHHYSQNCVPFTKCSLLSAISHRNSR